jgi:O-antigen/teichoic acid export membrane protein
MMWQARMYIIHRLPDHRRIFSQVFTLYSLLLIVCALGLALFSPEVLVIMVDPRYRGGAQVIPVVSLAYVFLGVGYYLQLGMFLASRTSLIGIVSIVAAMVNLTLNYFLIRYFGMMGAAWATLAGFAALAVGSYCLSERAHPLNLEIGRVIKALGLAILVYALSLILPPAALVNTLLLKVLLLAGFAGSVWLSRVLSIDELATLGLLTGQDGHDTTTREGGTHEKGLQAFQLRDCLGDCKHGVWFQNVRGYRGETLDDRGGGPAEHWNVFFHANRYERQRSRRLQG